MGFLGKRLSSVLLCGSMAFTLANSAGVVYAADDGQNAEEMAEQQDEANEGGEAQNEENEDSEVENNNEAQNVGDAKDVKGASTSGSSNGSGAAAGVGLLAGGLAAGAAIDRGVGYLKGKSEANNSSSSVSEEEVKKEIERQVKEAREDVGRMASVADDAVYGALSGWIGELIPGIDSMVSEWFGKNLSRSSRVAIVAAVIIHVIGLIVAGANVVGLFRNWGTKDKLGKTWRMLKISTDIFVPPIGIALQLAEGVIKATWNDKKVAVNVILKDVGLESGAVVANKDLPNTQGNILDRFGPHLLGEQGHNLTVNAGSFQQQQQLQEMQ